MNNSEKKIDKDNLVFQIAKIGRLRGINGKFISSSSKYNKEALNFLYEFTRISLQYFVESEKLSPVVYQIASNALTKVKDDMERTVEVIKYLEEWINKISAPEALRNFSEVDKYFFEVYTYDIYMKDLDVGEVYMNLRKYK
ncbi:hypothetical protein [Lactococcus allomyrinae]|uniref:Uncharacterized protein n=1 Tax=Lactococcus allomyrinae TaxID=2419773 RepID=A0A387BG81_9LACT|nr:hypothetical protein [Lactococcus allomyrinae]AYF99849.1 hypothetical protein D7I46_01370 [Lactococcus allomyrinae]